MWIRVKSSDEKIGLAAFIGAMNIHTHGYPGTLGSAWVNKDQIFPHRPVDNGEDKSKDSYLKRNKCSNRAFISHIYPKQQGKFYGKFERVIHISYTLSTVFGVLSTDLGRKRICNRT
jgi:hypothetical protein